MKSVPKGKEKYLLIALFSIFVLVVVFVAQGARVKNLRKKEAERKKEQDRLASLSRQEKKKVMPVVIRRKPGEYVLEGVIYDSAHPLAIINGNTLQIDERIDELVVKKISPEAVELFDLKNNRTLVLKI